MREENWLRRASRFLVDSQGGIAYHLPRAHSSGLDELSIASCWLESIRLELTGYELRCMILVFGAATASVERGPREIGQIALYTARAQCRGRRIRSVAHD